MNGSPTIGLYKSREGWESDLGQTCVEQHYFTLQKLHECVSDLELGKALLHPPTVLYFWHDNNNALPKNNRNDLSFY